MRSRLRKLTLGLPAVLAVLVLGACGDSHTKVTTGTYAGESGVNAPYLDVGALKYEVQLSRELNPSNSEDAVYFKGLTATESKLEPGEEWFGVFVQVYNGTSHTARATETMTISDTQGNVYAPILPSQENEYTYRGGFVRAKGQIPEPDTTPFFGPTQGALLLYKIKVSSLDNRPLEIKITNPEDLAESAKAELDV
jgi:hypothetical protein